MDETPTTGGPAGPTVDAAPPPKPPRAWPAVLAAILIAFGTGALTYREANTLLTPRVAAASLAGRTAVAGRQAPPAWIDEFARAFCSRDAAYVSAHVSGELDIGEGPIADAFSRRAWQCASSHYLGSATNTQGQHHVFVMTGSDNEEQWFVFTVADEKVVGID